MGLSDSWIKPGRFLPKQEQRKLTFPGKLKRADFRKVIRFFKFSKANSLKVVDYEFAICRLCRFPELRKLLIWFVNGGEDGKLVMVKAQI